MNAPLTPAEKWLLPIYLDIAELFGEEMRIPIRLVRQDLALGSSSGYSQSLVHYARGRQYEVFTDGVTCESGERLPNGRVNSNTAFLNASSEGVRGLGKLTLNFLAIGWRNYTRLRNVNINNPFDSIYVAEERYFSIVDNTVVSEELLLSFMVWFTAVFCENPKIGARYMATIVYKAAERNSRVEFEFDSNDPGIVGMLISHGQPVPAHLLN